MALRALHSSSCGGQLMMGATPPSFYLLWSVTEGQNYTVKGVQPYNKYAHDSLKTSNVTQNC